MFRKSLFVSLLVFAGLILSLRAQVIEGVIRYEMSMDMHRNIPADREELKAMIPQFHKQDFVLFFNAGERLYKAAVSDEPVNMQGRGGGGRMMMRMPGSETHISLGTQERTVAMEMMGRNLLIVDTLSLAPWRLGNEYMDIAGYRCQMAWYTDTVTNEEITAWFTVGLQPFLGPDRYASLPGAILALDINNGERVWVARSVEIKALSRNDIRKPTRGEVITRAQFNILMEEQRQRRQGGGFRF